MLIRLVVTQIELVKLNNYMNTKEGIVKNFEGKILGVCNYKKDDES